MYNWWVFLHLAGVLGFVASHGVSMFVLYRIRSETDRAKVLELATLSGQAAVPMYVSLGALLIGGIAAGIQGKWFSYWWIWASIGVLVATVASMFAVATPYFVRIKEACGVRPTGVPRVSDEELAMLLHSRRAHAITAIGVGGLLIILYLMIFKPGLL